MRILDMIKRMDISELVKDYQPTPEAIALLESTKIVFLCGITGAGKDAIQNQLLQSSDQFYRIVTSTTRPPRENDGVMEQDGREYYFYTLDQAREMVRNKQYFEVAKVHDKVNGVTVDEIQRIHDAGKIAIGDVNYEGVDYFHSHVPSITVIFVVPPSYEVWHSRLQRRYDTADEFEVAFPVRKESAIHELQWALDTSYLRFIINDTLDDACRQVLEIVAGAQSSDHGREQAETLLEQLQRS